MRFGNKIKILSAIRMNVLCKLQHNCYNRANADAMLVELEAIKYVATITKPHVNVRKCIRTDLMTWLHLEPKCGQENSKHQVIILYKASLACIIFNVVISTVVLALRSIKNKILNHRIRCKHVDIKIIFIIYCNIYNIFEGKVILSISSI